MRGQEAKTFTNIAATTDPFQLSGGAYVVDVVASGSGSATLQRLGPDQTTWITADTLAALTATGTTGAMALPPGSYRLAIATLTGVYASVVRVPGE